MTTRAHAAAGGRFLVDRVGPEEIFTREDLTEEQRLFGQTAAEFIQKEVLPVVKQLYAHDWVLTRRLLKKASELDLLRLEVPPAYGGLGLDLISASYVGEQIHVDRHAAARVFRQRRAEAAIPAPARQRRTDWRLRAHRAAGRI